MLSVELIKLIGSITLKIPNQKANIIHRIDTINNTINEFEYSIQKCDQ